MAGKSVDMSRRNATSVEVWKLHPDYDGYLVSQYGNVARVLLKSRGNFHASKDGKQRCVNIARAVWRVFVSETLPYRIYHKDGNKKNCAVSNLTDNMMDSGRYGNSRLTPSDVAKIRVYLKSGLTQNVLAVMFGVTRQAISYIKTGKTWGRSSNE